MFSQASILINWPTRRGLPLCHEATGKHKQSGLPGCASTPYMDWDSQKSHKKVANNLQVPDDVFMAFTQWAGCACVCGSPAKLMGQVNTGMWWLCFH